MSQKGHDSHGTGLRDVFDILLKEPSERLLSLTYQLGDSPEDDVIHVLCLIILQSKQKVLNKLHMLKDNSFAKHLAERWRMNGGQLEDFRDYCDHLQEFTGETLAVLARIFKVLSERRLCDPHLRNLAYQRAVSLDGQKTSSCDDLEYDRLREEAKFVCGPQFEELMCSVRDLNLGSLSGPQSVGETLKITDKSESGYSLASPLEASSSMPSYPTHLEISIPPTALFEVDKRSPEATDETKLSTISITAREQPHSFEEPKSNEPAPLKTTIVSKMDTPLGAHCRLDIQNPSPNQTTKSSIGPNCEQATAANPVASKGPVLDDMPESEPAEMEEARFYAFVILHSPEDTDLAENMKEQMERVSGHEGATFSEEFAIPGRSTLRCVEDAINNSAFTFLLLTRNFNTRMLETEIDTALIHSIHNKHKHNTVIPLLPRENSMQRKSMPLILHTIVPLEENKNFERKVKKSLCPKNYIRQKKIWEEEQRMKSQLERQEEQKRQNQYEMHPLGQGGGAEGNARWSQPSNIHINNANYIIIGNRSQMNVDHSGDAVKDDTIYFEEKQEPPI